MTDLAVLARFNPDGILDPAFRYTPNTEPPRAPHDQRPGVVYTRGSDAILVDGNKILTGGNSADAGNRGFLARYNVDGTFDSTFDDGAIIVESTHRFGNTHSFDIRDLDLMPDGRLAGRRRE